jgi:hypothetical protein
MFNLPVKVATSDCQLRFNYLQAIKVKRLRKQYFIECNAFKNHYKKLEKNSIQRPITI